LVFREECNDDLAQNVLKNSAAAAAALSLDWRYAQPRRKRCASASIYDHSGPFRGGGSVPARSAPDRDRLCATSAAAVGGKYKVVPVNADSQSKADVAINEVERLINQEKVDIVNGTSMPARKPCRFSAKVEAQKKILWITTAIATAVFKGQEPCNTSSAGRFIPTNTPRRS
jgi:branched-chain amino acid transport system substrate-binding protein